MRHSIRGKPVRCLALCLLAATMLFLWPGRTVQASPNTKIDELILVDNTSGGHVSRMYQAVRDQERHAGDVDQHTWLASLQDVGSVIDPVQENAVKQAICLWVGEQYLHGFADFTHYFNHDCEGADSDSSYRSNGDYIGYNAVGLARYLCGYDYQYEITVLDWLADGSPDWLVPPTYDDETGDLVTAGVQRSHMEHRTAHIDGLATDIQNWSARGPKLYVFALGPVSKEKVEGRDDHRVNGVSNSDIQRWNQAFQAALSNFTFIDIYQDIMDHNPYYSTGGDYGSWYDEQMYQWTFHLMWNTILNLNPNDEPPEPIVQSLYAVSSSLTAYMNRVLSPAADETHGDHLLPEANTNSIGNAGAFLGYGDKDYDYQAYITGVLSKTSSTVEYQALLGVESGASGTNNMYLYARYGRLLSDMGLDKTGVALTVGSPNIVQGGLLYILYMVTSGVNLLFVVVLTLLKGLNPFGFLGYAKTLANSAKGDMGVDDTLLSGTSGTKILAYIGELYDGFQGIGTVITVLLFGLLLAGTLLFWQRRYQYTSKAKHVLARMVFLAIGVPLLGVCYTSVLDAMDEMYSNSNANGTKLVASTFVDFKDWAKLQRLNPSASGTFVSDPSSGTGQGDVAGIASDDTYKDLRKTTAVINTEVGAVSGIDVAGDTFGIDLTEYIDMTADRSGGSLMGTLTENARTFRDGQGLLRMYMMGDFYTAASWESDTMAMITRNHNGVIGRRAGLGEDDPPDNAGTLYELFEETNETSDWMGRDGNANRSIFLGNGDHADWKSNGINLYSNGRLASQGGNRLGAANQVVYQGSTSGGDGRDSRTETGLSTVSLYNYLSTSFDEGQMTIYSNERAASLHTKRSHYSVNLIGSGAISILYYLSCFALLFVVAILGVWYGLGILVSNVRNGFRLLAKIPAAFVLGFQAILQVFVLVFTMVAEIIGTMFAYQVISELLLLFLTFLEQPLAARANAATAVGGMPGVAGIISNGLSGSLVSFYGYVGVSAILCIGMGGIALAKASRFQSCVCSLREYVYLKYVMQDALRDAYLGDGRQVPEPDGAGRIPGWDFPVGDAVRA